MKSHETKVDFPGIAILVIALEVLAALSLLFGGVSSVYMMFTGEGTIFSFIVLSFGGICGAFLIFAIAEFLQMLMKIEFNTRSCSCTPSAPKTVVTKKTTRRKTARRKKK